MKGLLVAFSFLALAGCAQPMVRNYMPFPEQTYAVLPKTGSGDVVGQVFLRTVGGDVKYGAGSTVLLLQETYYSQQFYLAWLNDERAPQIDPRAIAAGMSTQANGSGEYKFTNVPPGDYYVVSQVTWGVPTRYGISSQGGVVMGRAIVADDSVTTLMLTQ